MGDRKDQQQEAAEPSNLAESRIRPEDRMTDDKWLRKRALAAAAEDRRQADRRLREDRKEEARRTAERRKRLVEEAIVGVRDILGDETAAADWKPGTSQYDDDGVTVRYPIATTVILGVGIRASDVHGPKLWVMSTSMSELTLASFGRALEALDQRDRKNADPSA
jgi:hypothetical protein